MRKAVFLLIMVTLAIGQSLRSARSATPVGSLLDILPDGSGVALIDFQKVTASSLWTTLSSQDTFKGTIDKAQSEMADLGLKLSDVHNVAIVFPAGNLKDPTVAFSGGFDQSDLLRRLRANSKTTVTSEKYKNFDIYRVRNRVEATSASKPPDKASRSDVREYANNGTYFVFYDASTVVAGTLAGTRASIDVKSGEKPGLAQNTKLADALLQNPGAPIRFALTLTPSITSGLQSSELPLPEFSSIGLIFGTIDLAAGIDLNATLRSDSADHAKSLADQLNGLLTMARGFLGSMSDSKMAAIGDALKTVSVTNSDIDVKITGNLPTELLTALLSSSSKKTQ